MNNIASATGGVKAYEKQRAAWEAKVNDPYYEYDPLDSFAPPHPPVTHRHHFRLGVFQMRLGMTSLKKIERIRNGGRTDEEQAEKQKERESQRKLRVEESLKMALGGGGGGKKEKTGSDLKGGTLDEVVVQEVNDDATVESEMSYMTKQRLMEQELEEKILPVMNVAKKNFKSAILTLTLADELWVASGKADSMVGSDISTGIEIYYNRGRCHIFAGNIPQGIKDFNRVLEMNGDHIPTLVLRGQARIALGQYPQAKRDFAKILKRLDPEHRKAEEMLEECQRGVDNLTHADICKPDDERSYEVTAEGIRIRDRVAYRKLAQFGRSQKRKRMTDKKDKRDLQLSMQKKHEDERGVELVHTHKRADLARKRVERARKQRLEATAYREAEWKRKQEEKKKREEERRQKEEQKKEEAERWLMQAEEDLIRGEKEGSERSELPNANPYDKLTSSPTLRFPRRSFCQGNRRGCRTEGRGGQGRRRRNRGHPCRGRKGRQEGKEEGPRQAVEQAGHTEARKKEEEEEETCGG